MLAHRFGTGTCYLSSHCTRLVSTIPQWLPLDKLQDADDIHLFRAKAFVPESPIIFPTGHFCHLIPAVYKWFSPHPKHQTQINYTYMNQFAGNIVPLEITDSMQDNELFQRADAPLSTFLEWAANTKSTGSRSIYLAQASLQNLPIDLRRDLPTPRVVGEAGKGDVYDANIWLGIAPTYTPLHRDPNPNLFVQLAGQKTIRLVAPDIGQSLFEEVQATLGRSSVGHFRGDEMMKGPEKTILEMAIWGGSGSGSYRVCAGSEACLSRGDGVFIPKGWWHSFKGVGTGVTSSVSGKFLLLHRLLLKSYR